MLQAVTAKLLKVFLLSILLFCSTIRDDFQIIANSSVARLGIFLNSDCYRNYNTLIFNLKFLPIYEVVFLFSKTVLQSELKKSPIWQNWLIALYIILMRH